MRTLADRVQLVVDEEQSARASDGHVDEVVGYLAGDCHTGATELGRVEGVTSDWRRVILEGSFLDPVVVAGPATYNGADPGVVEVRKVTSDSFEIRFREWDYLDGQHQTAEDVFYLVAERGEAKLASGLVVEAGVAPATSAWSFVDLRAEFPSQPALFTTVVG